MTPEAKCKYEDRWTQMIRDIGDIRSDRRKDPTATWVRWAVPLVTTALIGVYGVLENRIDSTNDSIQSTQQTIQKLSSESIADRRTLAERQVSLETR